MGLFRYHCLWVREILLQWKIDKLTDQLWILVWVTKHYLPAGTKAHTSSVRRELLIRIRLGELHYELHQLQRQLGVL